MYIDPISGLLLKALPLLFFCVPLLAVIAIGGIAAYFIRKGKNNLNPDSTKDS